MYRWSVRALSLWMLLLGLLIPTSAGDKKADKLPRTGIDDANLASFDEMMERFVIDQEVPGAALAVAKDGKLVYARGFGYADRDPKSKMLVQPHSKFRIASISKPITAAAILRLIEMGKLKLDDHAFDLLKLAPPAMAEVDPRLHKVTIRELLQHTAGFDRDKSFDPMFRPIIIAKALGTPPPADPEHIVRYMLGHKLDFDPGARYAYSNFGYCVLGRVIEKVSGKGYEAFVHDAILKPLAIADTQLGKTLERAKGEVKYVDLKGRTGPAVVGPERGKQVPWPYGAWYLEAMDAHGGWISTAPDLVRYASSLNDPKKCPILKAESIRTMFARPTGLAGYEKNGKPLDVYYGCGWEVRVVNDKTGATNTWHGGSLDGTSTLLVRRADGLTWAVLFNARENRKGKELAGLIDPLVHEAADRVKQWPKRDLFKKG
jgi:CubicO group peptidase (beta-lactamase class C family)